MKRFALFFIFASFFIFFINIIIVPHKALADDCFDVTETPNLYQIDRSSAQATLFFTPVNSQIQSYTIEYGLKAGESTYSTTFGSGQSSGAISATVNDLDPNFSYSFRVRSNTNCANSPWSGWVSDNFKPKSQVKGVSTMPAPGSNTVLILSIVGFSAALGGAFLFKSSS